MKRKLVRIFLLAGVILSLCACQGQGLVQQTIGPGDDSAQWVNINGVLRVCEDTPDIVDPQCTSGYYTVALNVFDRLVEVSTSENGSEIVPSLAESWEISDDGLTYTFHLVPNVHFSNGNELTASDVLYTFKRLLTYPRSVNQSLVSQIKGAKDLREGNSTELEGFKILGDLDFAITLEKPYAAFLACLSTPGASIFDEETTEEAGIGFGVDPKVTIGTGPFVFSEWEHGVSMTLVANPDCWSGGPKCREVDILFNCDVEAQRILFEGDKLDILDLEKLSNEAEYFIRGDIYQDRLVCGSRVGIAYIALNQSIAPLDDVKVRKALQMAVDRNLLLLASYGGRGQIENGIFPHGLIGFNPDLAEITYSQDRARKLLKETGHTDDIQLDLVCQVAENQGDLCSIIASMWEKIGVHVNIIDMDDETFMEHRKAGELQCYTGMWSADFNDPDNFISTFFGSKEESLSRSIGYSDEKIIKRISDAKAIVDTDKRIEEYRSLEEVIVQEQCSWIPLYSLQHYFVVRDGVEGFKVSWNGWSSSSYRNVSIEGK